MYVKFLRSLIPLKAMTSVILLELAHQCMFPLVMVCDLLLHLPKDGTGTVKVEYM